MYLIILFIVLNVIISIYLENRKMKIANVSHAVMFIILSIWLILTCTGDIFTSYFQSLIGVGEYKILMDALSIGVAVGMCIVSPFVFLKILVSIMFFILGIYLTLTTIKSTQFKKLKSFLSSKVIKQTFEYKDKQTIKSEYKIFRLNCIMRC